MTKRGRHCSHKTQTAEPIGRVCRIQQGIRIGFRFRDATKWKRCFDLDTGANGSRQKSAGNAVLECQLSSAMRLGCRTHRGRSSLQAHAGRSIGFRIGTGGMVWPRMAQLGCPALIVHPAGGFVSGGQSGAIHGPAHNAGFHSPVAQMRHCRTVGAAGDKAMHGALVPPNGHRPE